MFEKKFNKELLLKQCKIYPAGIFLFGILTALVPLNIDADLPLWLVIILPIPIVAIMLTVSLQATLNFLLWFFLGIVSFHFNNYVIKPAPMKQIIHNPEYMQLNITTLDPSLSVLNIPWMNPPNYLFVNINSIKLKADSNQKGISGKVFLINKKSYPFEYGKSYTVEGILSLAEDRYNKSFANYLKSIDIIYSFTPEQIIPHQESNGHLILRKMIKLRDKILQICSYNIDDQSVNQFLAGILFGCRQGLDQNTKQQFLNTGTIHIIAISGSHIGILAILFLIFLRPVPIRIRYIAIPLFLLGYIIIIGYLPSAIRAFFMVSCFMLIKSILRTQKPMNVLFLTALLMLLFNPYSMMNPGFTFSFTIVSFLILGWDTVSTISECHNEIYYWKPKKYLSFSRKINNGITKNILIATSTTIIAGLASIPLQLYYNNIFTPIMPIVNILLLPLLFPLFFFCILKICVFPILHFNFVSSLFNFFISGIVNCIFKTVELGYNTNTSFYLPQPPLFFLLIFYLALVCILVFFQKKISWIFGITLILLTTLMIYSPLLQNNKAIFLKGSGNNPVSVILLNPKKSSAIVLNCPANLGFDIINVLKTEGINKISDIYAAKLNSQYAGSIRQILELYTPERIVILQKSRHNKLSQELKEFCIKFDIPLIFEELQSGKHLDDEMFSIKDGNNQYHIEEKDTALGQANYSIFKNGAKINSVIFVNSNKLKKYTVDLDTSL